MGNLGRREPRNVDHDCGSIIVHLTYNRLSIAAFCRRDVFIMPDDDLTILKNSIDYESG